MICWNDPYRIRTWKELINWVNEVGFLPLFANDVEGFSAEEHVPLDFYVSENEEGDTVWNEDEILSTELKMMAGFGKGGEKNYPGIVTALQMNLYLVITDFRRRKNKRGDEYGMAVSIMFPPETVWGYDLVTSAYKETPHDSWERIIDLVKEQFPGSDEEEIIRLIGKELR